MLDSKCLLNNPFCLFIGPILSIERFPWWSFCDCHRRTPTLLFSTRCRHQWLVDGVSRLRRGPGSVSSLHWLLVYVHRATGKTRSGECECWVQGCNKLRACLAIAAVMALLCSDVVAWQPGRCLATTWFPGNWVGMGRFLLEFYQILCLCVLDSGPCGHWNSGRYNH